MSRKYLSKRCHCRIPVGSDLSVADTLIRNTTINKKDRNPCLLGGLCVRLDPIARNIVTDDSTGFI